MKTLLLIAVTLSLHSYCLAAPTIRAVASNGNWTTASSWDLNRVPAHGDTIIIPFGKTINIMDVVNNLDNVVLKVYGSLRLSGGKISINTASMVTVYIGGRILGTGSPSEQLRIGTDKIWDGSNLIVLGPQLATTITGGFIPFFQNGITLPVKFVGFTVTARGRDALIQWSTAEEQGAYSFEVERSFDGASWTTIGSVSAAGNTQDLTHYTYTDRNSTTRTVYYRVKQVDSNGQYAYTPARSLKPAETQKEVKIASVGNNRLLLQFAFEVKEPVQVRYISMSGQVMGEQTLTQAVGQMIITIPSLSRGHYVISVSNGKDLNTATQVNL